MWCSAHMGAVRGEGPTDTAILVIRDITEGKRTEDILHTQRDLAIAFAAGPSLDEGLRLCFEAALGVSGMDCGGVYLFDDTTGELRLAFHTGLLESFMRCASSCKERRVIVSVQDEDCGISEADLPQIRNPFYTTKREEGGIGLGLAVAARIVNEHEGCAWNSSPESMRAPRHECCCQYLPRTARDAWHLHGRRDPTHRGAHFFAMTRIRSRTVSCWKH